MRRLARRVPRWVRGPRAGAELQRELRRWGLPGTAAAALLMVAAVIGLGVVPRARTQLADDERSLASAQAAARQTRGAAGRSGPDEARAFVESFPLASQRHRRISELFERAERLGLQPRRGEVRSLPAGDAGLARVQVTLPVEGRYEDLRRYVNDALRADAALALDGLRLERRDAQAALLQAELQWSVWMRPEPAVEVGSRRGVDGAP